MSVIRSRLLHRVVAEILDISQILDPTVEGIPLWGFTVGDDGYVYVCGGTRNPSGEGTIYLRKYNPETWELVDEVENWATPVSIFNYEPRDVIHLDVLDVLVVIQANVVVYEPAFWVFDMSLNLSATGPAGWGNTFMTVVWWNDLMGVINVHRGNLSGDAYTFYDSSGVGSAWTKTTTVAEPDITEPIGRAIQLPGTDYVALIPVQGKSIWIIDKNTNTLHEQVEIFGADKFGIYATWDTTRELLYVIQKETPYIYSVDPVTGDFESVYTISGSGEYADSIGYSIAQDRVWFSHHTGYDAGDMVSLNPDTWEVVDTIVDEWTGHGTGGYDQAELIPNPQVANHFLYFVEGSVNKQGLWDVPIR